jgi:hypothetical protein
MAAAAPADPKPEDIVFGVLEKKGLDYKNYELDELQDLLRAVNIAPEGIRDAQRGRWMERKRILFDKLWAWAVNYGERHQGPKVNVLGELLPAANAPKRIPYRKHIKNVVAFTGGVGLFFTVLSLLDKTAEKKKSR